MGSEPGGWSWIGAACSHHTYVSLRAPKSQEFPSKHTRNRFSPGGTTPSGLTWRNMGSPRTVGHVTRSEGVEFELVESSTTQSVENESRKGCRLIQKQIHEQHDIKARPNLRQVPPASDSQAISDSEVRKASVGDYTYGGSSSSSSSSREVRFQSPGEEGLGRAAFGSPDTLGIPPGSEERMEVDSSKGTKRALAEADEGKMLESLLYEGRNKFLGNMMALEIIEPVCEEEDMYDDQDQELVDDISGEHLETSRVKEARKTEIEFVEGMKVWKAVPRTEDMKVISTIWVDINTGDKANPNYRSRLVARELKKDTLSELFAAMPRCPR